MQMYPGYQQYQPQTYPTRLPQPMQPMPMMQQPVPQQAPQMQQAMMTLVTSKEQAMVAQIPFDGNTYYYYNTAADEVYSKRFDGNTGTSPLIEYQRRNREPDTVYAPMELVQQLAQQISAMQEQLAQVQATGARAGKRQPAKEADE